MQPIEQPLVICVCESLLLQLPLTIPVHFGEVGEPGNAPRRLRPEFLRGRLPQQIDRQAPGLLKDVIPDAHGHVAAPPPRVLRDRREPASDRVACLRIEVMELPAVPPRCEEWIATARDEV